MEETTKKTYLKICPSLAITTTIRVSPETNRFIRTLSALMGVPIIRRGKSSLAEIAYLIRRNKIKGFLVVFTKKRTPSRIDLYYSFDLRYYQIVAKFLLESIELHRRPQISPGILLEETNSHVTFIINKLFGRDSCGKFDHPITELKVFSRGLGEVLEFWQKNQKILTVKVRHVILEMGI